MGPTTGVDKWKPLKNIRRFVVSVDAMFGATQLFVTMGQFIAMSAPAKNQRTQTNEGLAVTPF